MPQQGDVVFVTGQKLPAGANLEFLGIVFEHFRGIGFWIDTDRVEEHIATHAFAEQFLHLSQARGFQRARVGTGGEDEVDGHHLVFDQVIKKPNRLAVLVNQRGVGKVVPAPLLGRGTFTDGRE
ncbi:hypothetical protein D3C84_873030 [compost metagenome]